MRRRDPRDDLASALIQAEEAGDKLSEDELLAMVFLLLIAGHETTVNLIGTGMLDSSSFTTIPPASSDPILPRLAASEA